MLEGEGRIPAAAASDKILPPFSWPDMPPGSPILTHAGTCRPVTAVPIGFLNLRHQIAARKSKGLEKADWARDEGMDPAYVGRSAPTPVLGLSHPWVRPLLWLLQTHRHWSRKRHGELSMPPCIDLPDSGIL